MKKMRKFISIFALSTLAFLSSCENSDWSFDDFDYTTVYFAYQYPVRTLVLGNDEEFDNSIDNQHKCIIKATMGGVYENETDRSVDITVTNSLCDDLYFSTGEKVQPMPSNYYQLSSDRIVIPKGQITGGVEVQLTNEFFADPLSVKNTYVIPLIMSNVQNADSILQGKAALGIDNPDRVVATDWQTLPKDYILYAVKYANPWDGILLRRGVDQITVDGTTTTNYRSYPHIEDAETIEFTTRSLTEAVWTRTVGEDVSYNIILTFNGNDCTLSTDTPGYEVSGTGKFVEKGEKNSFNGKDRDAIYLDYTLDMGGTHYATKDTLVMRDRQVKGEWFTVTKQ